MNTNLNTFVKKFIRKIWVIPIFVIAGLIIGNLMFQRTPLYYSSTATLISLNIENSLYGVVATYEDMSTARRVMQDFREVVRSDRVVDEAINKLSQRSIRLSPQTVKNMIGTSQSESSNILRITASANVSTHIKDVSNAVAAAYCEVIKEFMGVAYVNVLDEAKDITRSGSISQNSLLILGGAAGALLSVLLIYLVVILDTRISSVQEVLNIVDTKVMIIPEHTIK